MKHLCMETHSRKNMTPRDTQSVFALKNVVTKSANHNPLTSPSTDNDRDLDLKTHYLSNSYAPRTVVGA